MRRAISALALACACAAPGSVMADHAPAFVVPSRPGVPIVINGRDASWGVVEGDWGLYRPGHGTVTVIHGTPVLMRMPGAFYPYTGRKPGVGRYEIETPADRRPRAAQPYSRSWSAESARVPASVAPQYDMRDLPPVTIEAQPRRRSYRPCRPGLYC